MVVKEKTAIFFICHKYKKIAEYLTISSVEQGFWTQIVCIQSN